jgi:hypothetical protein
MDEFWGIDQPRELPADMRDRLESALLNPLAGIDAPRPLPDHLRQRIIDSVGDNSRNARALTHRILGVAAALLIAAGTAGLLAHSSPRNRSVATTADAPAATAGEAGQVTAGAAAETTGSAAAGETGAATTSTGIAGGTAATPPPRGGAAVASSGQVVAPASPRIAIVSGDADMEAGFRAYVDRYNRDTNRPITIVKSGPVAATVNLSDQPLTTSSGLVLETLVEPGGRLKGDVFDAAGDVERQARVAVDAVFPDASPGRRAVIFQTSSGVLSNEVPAALEAELKAKEVVPVHVTIGSAPTPFPPADAAFLSLDAASAKTWFADAATAGFAPVLGTTGLSPLVDASLVASMPVGTRVVSPYLMVQEGQGRLNAESIHGWLTAKLLTETLRRTGEITSAGLRVAINGYDDGFGRLYATRSGTNVRSPDAVVLRADGSGLVPQGSFLEAHDG